MSKKLLVELAKDQESLTRINEGIREFREWLENEKEKAKEENEEGTE